MRHQLNNNLSSPTTENQISFRGVGTESILSTHEEYKGTEGVDVHYFASVVRGVGTSNRQPKKLKALRMAMEPSNH